MAHSFFHLVAGYFAYEDRVFDRTLVLDSSARRPDAFFGPAAWCGKHGPSGGVRVLAAVPTRLGQWDQVAELQWKWCMPDGGELEEAPPSWPRRISISNAPEAEPLQRLHGVEVADEAALRSVVIEALSGTGSGALIATSAHGRTEAAMFSLPHIFGARPEGCSCRHHQRCQ